MGPVMVAFDLKNYQNFEFFSVICLEHPGILQCQQAGAILLPIRTQNVDFLSSEKEFRLHFWI